MATQQTSQNRISQMTNKLSNQSSNQNQPSYQQLYEGSGLQFIPPQHKYIQCQKYKSAFFQDNNQEEYVIQRAFKGNNFTYLRDLPDSISRNCILEGRKERVMEQVNQEYGKRNRSVFENLQAKAQKLSQIKKSKIGTLGYFQLFPYKESDYQLPKKLANMQRQQNIKKRKDVSQKQFRPAGFDKKQKYQDPFRYIDRLDSTTAYCGSQKYIFPSYVPQDVYDAFKQSQRRRKMIEKQLILAGEFYPSKADSSLHQVSKAKLPEIINEIEFYFKKFLKNNYGYFIGVNKRDHIQIMFQSKYINDQRLQMALSGMLEHEILTKYVLRRNYKKWGIINANDYLQFVVFPPWVKQPQEELRANTAPTQNKTKRQEL